MKKFKLTKQEQAILQVKGKEEIIRLYQESIDNMTLRLSNTSNNDNVIQSIKECIATKQKRLDLIKKNV